MLRRTGFTLIELLIVVAIIAILAAIAVPNFLEAQTRAKVSRAKADMQAMGTGLEMYHIDWNMYPSMNPLSRAIAAPGQIEERRALERLTTPISYLNGITSFRDPFPPKGVWSRANLDFYEDIKVDTPAWEEVSKVYWYVARNSNFPDGSDFNWRDEKKPLWWVTESSGPDMNADAFRSAINHAQGQSVREGVLQKLFYDPSNGTISRGSIFRVGGSPAGSGQDFFRHAEMANH